MKRLVLSFVIVAVISLSTAQAASPQDKSGGTPSRLERALELLREGNFEAAKTELLEQARLDPRNPQVHNLLGSVYDRLGRIDEAVGEYRQAIKLQPDNAAAFNNLGLAYLRLNRSGLAIESFLRALKIDPESATSHYNLGLVYLGERKYASAVSHLEKARQKQPADPGILFNLGTAYLEQGNARACLSLFELEAPGNTAFTRSSSVADNVPEIQVLLGAALSREKRPDEAELHLRRALELRPGFPDALFKLGLLYQQKGKMSEAVDYLEKALAQHPSLSAAIGALEMLAYEPIVTIWLGYAAAVAMPGPIARLDDAPGQWVLDRPDILAHASDADRPPLAQLLAVVISASGPHMASPHTELARAADAQLRRLRPALPPCVWSQVIAEKRATYACTPQRPSPAGPRFAPGIYLAGDYVDTEYPATLEAAVRSGVAAAEALLADRR